MAKAKSDKKPDEVEDQEHIDLTDETAEPTGIQEEIPVEENSEENSEAKLFELESPEEPVAKADESKPVSTNHSDN